MASNIYVGLKANPRLLREVFRAQNEPTMATHGEKYNAVIGPFRTVRGAKAMVHYGFSNPHMQHVRDAERIGKKYADNLKPLPLSKGVY